MIKTAVGGKALRGAGRSLQGDFSNPWRAGLGTVVSIGGAGLLGYASSIKAGGAGGLLTAGAEANRSLIKAFQARAKAEQDLIKTTLEITKLEEKRQAVFDNA